MIQSVQNGIIPLQKCHQTYAVYRRRFAFRDLNPARKSKVIQLNYTPHTHHAPIVSFSETDFVPFYHFHFCRAVVAFSCVSSVHSSSFIFSLFCLFAVYYGEPFNALNTQTHTHTLSKHIPTTLDPLSK